MLLCVVFSSSYRSSYFKGAILTYFSEFSVQFSLTISARTTPLNQGVRQEARQIVSIGTGAGAANIHLTGVGSAGTDFCNGVAIEGAGSAETSLSETVITSIDSNIVLERTAQGSVAGNQALSIDPASLVETTRTKTITYIEH